MIVDIQPSYESYIPFLDEFVNFLNKNTFNSITYLYNGPELGMETETDMIEWLYENGLKKSKFDQITFQDKGYAFFRSFMDLGMDKTDLINLIRYMYKL